jgi:hypothetical protein
LLNILSNVFESSFKLTDIRPIFQIINIPKSVEKLFKVVFFLSTQLRLHKIIKTGRMILNGNLDTPIKNSKLYKDNIHTASSIKKFLFFLITMTIAKSNRRQVTQKIAKKISRLSPVYSKFSL